MFLQIRSNSFFVRKFIGFFRILLEFIWENFKQWDYVTHRLPRSAWTFKALTSILSEKSSAMCVESIICVEQSCSFWNISLIIGRECECASPFNNQAIHRTRENVYAEKLMLIDIDCVRGEKMKGETLKLKIIDQKTVLSTFHNLNEE